MASASSLSVRYGGGGRLGRCGRGLQLRRGLRGGRLSDGRLRGGLLGDLLERLDERGRELIVGRDLATFSNWAAAASL